MWSEQDFTVTFSIDPPGGTEQSTQTVFQAKVTFDKAKKPGVQYYCDNCTGYHRRELNKVQTYYLMVPVNAAKTASNVVTSEASGKDSKAQINQWLIGLVVAQASLASPSPPTLSQPKQVVTVTGLSENTSGGAGTNMNATIQSNSQQLGTLYLQPVHPRTYDVYLHFVAAQNSQGNPTNVSSKLKKTDTLVSGIEAALNKIWGTQADVTFNVYPPVGNDAQLINYDLNNDGKLTEAPIEQSINEMGPNGTFISNCPAETTESYTIMSATVPSNTWIYNCSPPNDSNNLPTIHVYFVQSIANVPGSGESGIQAGFTAGIGTPFIFIQDDLGGENQNNIIAHEIGHGLGMHHNADKCTLTTIHSQPTFTCTSTDNPNITITNDPTVDSDFISPGPYGNSAADSLMWYDAPYATPHIGWPSLTEMNQLQLARGR